MLSRIQSPERNENIMVELEVDPSENLVSSMGDIR
jgi:hypothetical protein